MRITAIHAHPDDADILAGATLAMLTERGHAVTIVTGTAGDCGSREYGPEELARMRMAEQAASAKLIGADYRCLGFKDMAIFNDDASRRRVTELIRELRPEIVLTASPHDYHCDHEAISVLTRDACFAAGAPNYKTGNAPFLEKIPHLYFMDSVDGVDREGRPIEPEWVVDIEGRMDVKRAMFACHESQRKWLKAQHGMDDCIAEMEKWSAHMGARRGLRFAEGWRQYRVHPYPTDDALRTALGVAG